MKENACTFIKYIRNTTQTKYSATTYIRVWRTEATEAAHLSFTLCACFMVRRILGVHIKFCCLTYWAKGLSYCI